MKKYLQCFILFLIVSCASDKKEPVQKNYSEDTNRTFEMIERGGSYYLKKAPAYNPPPKIEIPSKRRVTTPIANEEIIIDENINYQAKPLTQEIRAIPKKEDQRPVLKNTQSSSKADERLIEINQNLAFYCMKHRKNPVYGGDEAKCMKYVNAVMNKCQKHHRIVNSKLLNCIQKNLKNR